MTSSTTSHQSEDLCDEIMQIIKTIDNGDDKKVLFKKAENALNLFLGMLFT